MGAQTKDGKKSSGRGCLFGHKWDGCVCEKCGKTRDEGHAWDLCAGKCTRCGKTCQIQHAWDGCVCARCGATRDANHTWEGCVCRKCGKESHRWIGCVCAACGAVRYVPIPTTVPVPGTYNSRREGTVRDANHRGPWERDPDNPCVIVCKACGQKAWEHQYETTGGARGASPGGGSILYTGADGKRCTVCGYWTAPGCHGPKVRKEGYCTEEDQR